MMKLTQPLAMSFGSSVELYFNSPEGLSLLNMVSSKRLPVINTLTLKKVNYSPTQFETFLLNSFPEKVNNLRILDAGKLSKLLTYRLQLDSYQTL